MTMSSAVSKIAKNECNLDNTKILAAVGPHQLMQQGDGGIYVLTASPFGDIKPKRLADIGLPVQCATISCKGWYVGYCIGESHAMFLYSLTDDGPESAPSINQPLTELDGEKVTCMAISERLFLAIGTESGAVYFFSSEDGSFLEKLQYGDGKTPIVMLNFLGGELSVQCGNTIFGAFFHH